MTTTSVVILKLNNQSSHIIMKDSILANLVTHAVSLDREIAEKSQLLKKLKADLVLEASIRKAEHQSTDSGGASWIAEGADGCVARIAFPAPSLKASIQSDGHALQKVKAAAGALFNRLFIPTITYKPVTQFREEAENLLGRDARKLIKLCQSDSAPRVSFETAFRPTQV